MTNYDEEIKKILSRALANIAQAMFDDYVRENAEFRSRSGLTAKIVRKMHGETCEWCRALAGIYEYGEEADGVYQRHDNCDCTVEYVTEKERQNVWTRQWTYEKNPDKIEARKLLSNAHLRTANMPPEELARAVDEWYKRTEIDIPQSEKEYVYEELDNNLTIEEKEQALVHRPIGNYYYTAINKGHNQYKIINKQPILESTGDEVVDRILDEVLDFDWRELL